MFTSVRHLGVFRACMYLHKLGMLHVFPFTCKIPPLFNLIFPGYSRLHLCSAEISCKALCGQLWLPWSAARGMEEAKCAEPGHRNLHRSVSVHRDKWLLNNSIHNMESMKCGKEKTTRIQLSIGTTLEGPESPIKLCLTHTGDASLLSLSKVIPAISGSVCQTIPWFSG